MPSFDLSRLDPSAHNSALFAALVELRTKHLRRRADEGPGGEFRAATQQARLVRRLVRLLGRPNSKIVDVTLSILGNLMLSEAARKAVSIVYCC